MCNTTSQEVVRILDVSKVRSVSFMCAKIWTISCSW